MIEILIGREQEQQRLDRYLKKYLPKASLSHIYKMIRKDVKVNGKRAKPEYVLALGDVLRIYAGQEVLDSFGEERKLPKAKRQFAVVYEDDHLLAVNKPRGLLTHGDQFEKKNTLVNQVIDYLVAKGDYAFSRSNTFIPAPVNRLDRNTSGIVLFGKNNGALRLLNRMIKEKTCIRKFYLAIGAGALEAPAVLRSAMVKDEKRNRIHLREVSGNSGISDGNDEGKYMETILRPLAVKDGFSLVEAELVTGRTHQIRAHMASKGLPIIGDGKYGDPGCNERIKERFGLSSQFLHAYRVEFGACPAPLDYLEGKVLTAPLSDLFSRIKLEIFGEE